MWLDTDRGNRIPAFHIRRGFPLTVLVSHANAEDLGLVLQYWAYMSQQLQVDVFAYEYSGYGHATGRCLLSPRGFARKRRLPHSAPGPGSLSCCTPRDAPACPRCRHRPLDRSPLGPQPCSSGAASAHGLFRQPAGS